MLDLFQLTQISHINFFQNVFARCPIRHRFVDYVDGAEAPFPDALVYGELPLAEAALAPPLAVQDYDVDGAN